MLAEPIEQEAVTPPGLELEAYLRRIRYAGSRAPTQETLRAIAYHHTTSIAFENLNSLSGRPVLLDLPSLQQKIVRDGRGGYCYEQNSLLSHVLRSLGFHVAGLMARVLVNQPEDSERPRTHMVLKVDIEQIPYMVDVGFGGMTLTGAIRLEADIEQPTPHEPYRFVRRGDAWQMQALVQSEWRTLYRFDLQPQLSVDYELANWYTSTHPRSHFTTNLGVARVDKGRRYALRDSALAIHHTGGASEHHLLTSVAELRDTLETLFQLRVPDDPDIERALLRVVEGG